MKKKPILITWVLVKPVSKSEAPITNLPRKSSRRDQKTDSKPGHLITAEGELEKSDNLEDIVDEKEDCIEWDSAYARGSPLKNASDITEPHSEQAITKTQKAVRIS